MHVKAWLFKYTPCKIEDDYIVIVNSLTIEDHIQGLPEFTSVSPLLMMPFGSYSTMIHSYDCYRNG